MSHLHFRQYELDAVDSLPALQAFCERHSAKRVAACADRTAFESSLRKKATQFGMDPTVVEVYIASMRTESASMDQPWLDPNALPATGA